MSESANPSPLRILQVVDTLDSGGMEQQIIALTNRLPSQQFTFEFCCLRHRGILAEKLKSETTIHQLNKPEGFRLSAVSQLRTLLRQRRFDLVHSHNLGPLIYASLATNWGLKVPILHGEHAQLNADELSSKRTWQRKLFYSACKAVHTVSFGQREELLRRTLTHPRLMALQNGVNVERFHPANEDAARHEERRKAGIPEQAFVVGMVARFGKYKRHAALISAFLPIAKRHPEAMLVLVGDGGSEREAVHQWVQSAGNQRQQIILAGFQADPAPWYRLFDLLVVPSENEGLSNVTLEALASGIPVLTNAICGAKELIEDGKQGWIRDLNSLEKLAAELQKVISLDARALRAMGAAGRERACRHFSWDGMAEAYASCFRSCIAAR